MFRYLPALRAAYSLAGHSIYPLSIRVFAGLCCNAPDRAPARRHSDRDGRGLRGLDQEKLRQAPVSLLTTPKVSNRRWWFSSSARHMGSAFIEVMFRTWNRLHFRNGRLVLCGVQPLCHEALCDPFGYNARLVRGCRRSSRGNTCHINVAHGSAIPLSARKTEHNSCVRSWNSSV